MHVIDFHFHPGRDEHAHPWVMDFARSIIGENAAEVMNSVCASTETLLAFIDEMGYDYILALAEESPITSGVASNEFIAEICGGHPRLIPVCNINPGLKADPARDLTRYVNELGFRGLKLHPTYQMFYPNESKIYPLYARAEELGIPVLIHTGSSVFKGSRMKYGDPLFVDDIAVDFPALKIVMCHCGRGFWYDSAFFLTRLHENVYMDITGLPPQKLLDYFPELERVADKVVFGTDWPAMADPRQAVQAVRDLPLKPATIEKILWRNAARLLDLPLND